MEMALRKDRVGYLAGWTIIDPGEGDGFTVPRITARDSKIRFTRV